jgi:hypothetical protein
MKNILKGTGIMLVLTSTALAEKPILNYKSLRVPVISEIQFDEPEFIQEKKNWNKLKRKVASEMSFSNSDLSADLQQIRDEWLTIKTGNEMDSLLKKSYANYNSYSEDSKYFLAQMHTAIPLRGIVWRLRPLFENSKGFLGNKSTHVATVQAVRGIATTLKMILPTNQTDAMIQFFTEPSDEMAKKEQFQTVEDFQRYLTEEIAPSLNEAVLRIHAITKNAAHKNFVWDNKMIFGRGTFQDDLQRFTGHGPAEINFTLATLYRGIHNIFIYCAYNQDATIKVAGEMGTHLGIDSTIFSSKREDLGITDEERVSLIKKAARNDHFLELRNYQGTDYGSRLMRLAYTALKSSVVYAERSFDYLQGREANKMMALNPILFQSEVSPNLEKGVKNMRAVVMGEAEVRDPVTGETVALNIPLFYHQPPKSLSDFLPTDFEGGETHKTIKNKKGETLKVRNYLRGRSIAWDNQFWQKYVTSAQGKYPGYMAEARRIIQYSFGTSSVFGLPEMFVD